MDDSGIRPASSSERSCRSVSTISTGLRTQTWSGSVRERLQRHAGDEAAADAVGLDAAHIGRPGVTARRRGRPPRRRRSRRSSKRAPRWWERIRDSGSRRSRVPSSCQGGRASTCGRATPTKRMSAREERLRQRAWSALRSGAARSVDVARSAKLSTSSSAGEAPMMTGEKAAAATPDSDGQRAHVIGAGCGARVGGGLRDRPPAGRTARRPACRTLPRTPCGTSGSGRTRWRAPGRGRSPASRRSGS